MKNKKHNALWLRFDRILSQDLLRQVIILVGLLFVIFLISFFLLSLSGVDWQTYCHEKHISRWVFPLYLLIDGNAFSNLYVSERVSKLTVFISCLIYILGVIIFTGMIISVMTNMIERRVEEHKEGLIHYLKAGHYIIMGYDDVIPSFIKHIFNKDKDAYVLVLTSAKVTQVKEKLRKSFSEMQMKHVIVNYGHRTSADFYRDICLETAEQVYIIGYRSKTAHDAINVECVDSICNYLSQPNVKDKPKKITCVFKDLDTYASFKTSEIFRKVEDLDIEFVPYNLYAGWAKQVFVKRFYHDMENPDVKHPYPAVYGKGYCDEDENALTENDTKFVHLVFVGTTNFAVAFAMEAAHVLHFPNFNHNNKLKTKITFIDINADKEKDEFITRNRHFFEVQSYTYIDLSEDVHKKNAPDTSPTYFNEKNGYERGNDFDFLDVEFEFIKGDVFSRKVQEEISNWATEHNKTQYLSVFLALADQRQNFVMGMNMPDEIYNNAIPIFIRQDRSDNLVTNLRMADTRNQKLNYYTVNNGLLNEKDCDARYAHIYPFGMNEAEFNEDNHSLKRAKLIHYLYSTAEYETYKFQSILTLDAMSEEKIWEEANRFWKELSVAHKWSNLYSSYTIRTKLATLRAMRHLKLDDKSKDYTTLSETEVEELAMIEHNRWNVEKLLMGYRKPHMNEDKYRHPEHADKLKKNKDLFIHHDIRPFSELGNIKEMDREFSRYIPWIMKMTEKND